MSYNRLETILGIIDKFIPLILFHQLNIFFFYLVVSSFKIMIS